MTSTRWFAPLLVVVGWVAGAADARAQPRRFLNPGQRPPKEYEKFEEDEANLSQILSRKLLVEELRRRLGESGLPALKKFTTRDLEGPEALLELKKSLEGLPALKLGPEEMKKLQPLIDAAQKPAEPPSQDRGTSGPAGHFDPPANGAPPQPPESVAPAEAPPAWADDALQEQFSEWAQQMALRLEGTRLGEELSRSAAVREGLRSLGGVLTDRVGGKLRLPGQGLARLVEGVRLPKSLDFPLPDFARLKAPSLSLPSLPRPNLNLSLPRWRFGFGGLGGGPSGVGGVGLGASQAILWTALGVLLLALLWRLRNRAARPGRPGTAAWQLGPWPVSPEQVATRADLVRAFEHLALLRLGRDARALNHRLIAARLGGSEEFGQAAADLAALYEQARYAPGDEPLAPGDLDAARRNLCLLAGVAPA